jgi:Holliday junction resolvase-like predicted endonuclease
MTTAAEMSWDEIKVLVAELAIQSKETDRKFRETDQKFQETEAQMRETDRKMREVFARFDNLSRRFGDLGNRLGEFVEAMVEPALVDLFRARGLDVSEVYRRVTSRRGGERIEIDLLVVDGDTAVAVECKSRLTKEEVERHVERMNKFKRLLPKYADMRIHGAVAGMVVDEDAVEAAQAAGLWVLAQSGETVTLRNDPGFTPRVW